MTIHHRRSGRFLPKPSALLLIALFTILLPNAAFSFQPTPIRSFHRRTHRPSLQTTSLNADVASFYDSAAVVISAASSSPSESFLTNENIKAAFNVATFGPQIFWLFLILIPNTEFTKKIMGGYEAVTAFALVHLFIVIASIVQTDGTAPIAEFADVFDPNGDPQAAMIGMMKYPNFVSEEWPHVLTWDLFVGRFIWLDGLKRGIFTGHSVLLCNLIGPPGLLLHWLTCLVTGKGLGGNEALGLEEQQEGSENN